MALFWADSLVLYCSNVESAKQWSMKTFDCKQVKVPPDWDDPLPSDVALRLPGSDDPTILLCSKVEIQRAGFERENTHILIFTDKLRKANEYLLGKDALPGPIQDGGGTQFFEIRDPEGNVIEICKEP
jgi:hypothetical protein